MFKHDPRVILAEGVGFEPTIPIRYTGFQDRRNRPLCHPSSSVFEHEIEFPEAKSPRFDIPAPFWSLLERSPATVRCFI